ncbi:Thiol-disulfide oxidoreductase D [Leminorella richardii]|uniref:Thiol-disulfide oxidoreductase D n=1 Tax=Leminorella richardii TaxID=158841 RepID=A0A2X4V012_9GAMM|nr:DsbA family protein [Leminorella richardii]SQI41448.1 Thiol-disulfide oxidoreductase D [Leminorella richardii]
MNFSLSTFLKISLMALASMSFIVTAAPLTQEQQNQVRDLIRETLVNNPQILEDAVTAWQQQSAERASAQLSTAIKQHSQALFSDAASPRIGAKNPKLTLVLFTDYNCPYCKQFDPLVEKIVNKYPDVAVVIKLLPFKGETSHIASEYALTLWKQNPSRFGALHQRLMSKKGYHSESSIANALKSTDNDALRIDEKAADELRSSLTLAEALGVQGTPATLIGEKLIPGAIGYEDLEQLVEAKLSRKSS